MTLVCARLDKSFGIPRITALADTRASSRREDGTWKTVSDTTVKLFLIPVKCFRGDSLSPVIGAWSKPYFETLVGVGFAGSCFEALTVIAHISGRFSELIAPNGDEPHPTKEGLVHLAARITDSYFSTHSGLGNPLVRMLMFGFEAEQPWLGRISRDFADLEAHWSVEVAKPDTLEAIGAGSLIEQYAKKWKQDVLTTRDSFEDESAAEVDRKRATEEQMLKHIESEFAASIGGVLQRVELGLDGNRVVGGFTRDDRPYLDGADWSVNPNALLGGVPIVESMG